MGALSVQSDALLPIAENATGSDDDRLSLPAGFTARSASRNVLLMSVCFCFIFMSFSSAQVSRARASAPPLSFLEGGTREARARTDRATDARARPQNFATSRTGTLGTNTVGVLYVVFTVATLFSSAAVRKLGPKLAMLVGSFTYAGYVAANILYTPGVMYPAGALLGVGAALIWTGQGVYITRSSRYYELASGLPARSTVGHFNGVFWSIFQVNQFLGNLLVALLFAYHISERTVFAITSLVALGGCLCLQMLRNLPNPDDEKGKASARDVDEAGVGGGERDAWAQTMALLTQSARLLSVPRMYLLVPIILYVGLSNGFIFGQFPALIDSKSWKFFVMASFGLADAISSIAVGSLSDRVGRTRLIALAATLHAAVYAFLAAYTVPQHAHGAFFALAIVWAVGDAVWNTQLYAVLGAFFGDQTEPAFANMKFFQALTTAVAFLYNKHVGEEFKLGLLLGTLVVGVLFMWVCHRREMSLDRGTAVAEEAGSAAPLRRPEASSA